MAGKTNYSIIEKSVLFELIEKNKDIIESKKNDGRMVDKKKKVWDEIQKDFASASGVSYRTTKQLKAIWKNMKCKAKKDVAHEKKERRKTGGGPQNVVTDDMTNKICELIPQQINSLENSFDDDHEPSEINQSLEKSMTGNVLTSSTVKGGAADTLPEKQSVSSAKPSSNVPKSLFTLQRETDDAPPLAFSAPQDQPESSDIESVQANSKSSSFSKALSSDNSSSLWACLGKTKYEPVKSELLEIAKREHEGKMKLQMMKEEVLELKKIKLQMEIAALQGCQVTLVTDTPQNESAN